MNWDNLDEPLFEFHTGDKVTTFTQRLSYTGVSITGSTGAGKSSSSFKKFLKSYIHAGYGGLLLTVKNTDAFEYEQICIEAGRMQDVRIIRAGGEEKFNFLHYEYATGGTTDGIVDLLKTVIEAGEVRATGGTDPFWEQSVHMVLTNVVDLCLLAWSTVSVQLIYDISASLPKENDIENSEDDNEKSAFQNAHERARQNVLKKVADWEQRQSPDYLESFDNVNLYEEALFEDVPDARTFKMLDQFFVETLKSLAGKTRSIVDVKILNFLFKLLRDPIYSIFCNGDSTVTPDNCFINGTILILDMPIKKYGKVGRDIQLLCKLLHQRAFEKRDLKVHPRPLVIASDEAQSYLISKDIEFQLTARSARIATIYATQSILTYFSVLDGRNPEYQVKAWLSNLGCKVWHLNTCVDTNKWASEIIGTDYFVEQTYNNTISKEISQSSGASYKLREIVLPMEFTKLRNGGELNRYEVEAFLHIQGTPIDGYDNHLKVVFIQDHKQKTN